MQKRQRQEILEAFQRGIDAVVKQYNVLHPTQPLQTVLVGSLNNKLLMEIDKKFQMANIDERVNDIYPQFKDAFASPQYILYQNINTLVQQAYTTEKGLER